MNRRGALALLATLITPMTARGQFSQYDYLKIYGMCTSRPTGKTLPNGSAEMTVPLQDEGGCFEVDPTMGSLTINLEPLTKIRVKFGGRVVEVLPQELMGALEGQ
jgi:hypothetical protein